MVDVSIHFENYRSRTNLKPDDRVDLVSLTHISNKLKLTLLSFTDGANLIVVTIKNLHFFQSGGTLDPTTGTIVCADALTSNTDTTSVSAHRDSESATSFASTHVILNKGLH